MGEAAIVVRRHLVGYKLPLLLPHLAQADAALHLVDLGVGGNLDMYWLNAAHCAVDFAHLHAMDFGLIGVKGDAGRGSDSVLTIEGLETVGVGGAGQQPGEEMMGLVDIQVSALCFTAFADGQHKAGDGSLAWLPCQGCSGAASIPPCEIAGPDAVEDQGEDGIKDRVFTPQVHRLNLARRRQQPILLQIFRNEQLPVHLSLFRDSPFRIGEGVDGGVEAVLRVLLLDKLNVDAEKL